MKRDELIVKMNADKVEAPSSKWPGSICFFQSNASDREKLGFLAQ